MIKVCRIAWINRISQDFRSMSLDSVLRLNGSLSHAASELFAAFRVDSKLIADTRCPSLFPFPFVLARSPLNDADSDQVRGNIEIPLNLLSSLNQVPLSARVREADPRPDPIIPLSSCPRSYRTSRLVLKRRTVNRPCVNPIKRTPPVTREKERARQCRDTRLPHHLWHECTRELQPRSGTLLASSEQADDRAPPAKGILRIRESRRSRDKCANGRESPGDDRWTRVRRPPAGQERLCRGEGRVGGREEGNLGRDAARS